MADDLHHTVQHQFPGVEVRTVKYVSCRKGFDSVDEFSPDLQARMGEMVAFALGCDREIVMVHGYNCESGNVQDAYRSNVEMMHEESVLPCDGGAAGFLWPGLGGNWIEAAEFHRAQRMADGAAPWLAKYLATAKDPVVVTHSLGARVALQAAASGAKIRTLALMGAAVDEDALSNTYLKALPNIGKIIVFHSLRDEVLGRLYRLDQMAFALGFKGPKIELPSVESVDVTMDVSGHNEYRHSRAIWRKIKETL